MLMHVKSSEVGTGKRGEGRPAKRRRHVLSFAATWLVLATLMVALRAILDGVEAPRPLLDLVGYAGVLLFAFAGSMALVLSLIHI